MNKVCMTQRGLQFFKQDNNEEEQIGAVQNYSTLACSRRTSSLPQLMSAAQMTQKQQISTQLSRLTLRLSELKEKGLRKIMVKQEDEHLCKIMQEQFANRKEYLKTIVPVLVKRSRDNLRFGNIQGRLERGRAYIDRLQHNFDKKYVFHVPKKVEE